MNGYNAEAAEFEIKRLQDCCESYRAQIDAAQAKNARLREHVQRIAEDQKNRDWQMMGISIREAADELIATPSGDDSALKERLNSLKERCANMALDMGGRKIADAIRALED